MLLLFYFVFYFCNLNYLIILADVILVIPSFHWLDKIALTCIPNCQFLHLVYFFSFKFSRIVLNLNYRVVVAHLFIFITSSVMITCWCVCVCGSFRSLAPLPGARVPVPLRSRRVALQLVQKMDPTIPVLSPGPAPGPDQGEFFCFF